MKNTIAEEQRYQFDRFHAKIAFELGCHAVEVMRDNALDICIDIHAFNKTLFHYSSDGCAVNHEDWLKKKRNSVLYFSHSTKFLNIKNNNDPSVLATKYGLALDRYCITQGGFPIYVKGCGVVGSICVSGLLPEEDHQFIIDLLEWYFHASHKSL